MPTIARLRIGSPRALGFAAFALVAALATALSPSIVTAQTPTPAPGTSQWKATVTGASEVPATSSTATGEFTATLDETNKTFSWVLNVPNITNATMAHLHQGAAGTNGPVVLPLFTPPLSQTSANSINTSSVSREFNLSGPLMNNWDAFVTAVKAGNIYVNVHTTANPGGEIRGQVVSASATATPTATATATATSTATATPTPTATGTGTPSATATATASPTSTGTAAPTGTTTVPRPANTGTGGSGSVASTPLLIVMGMLGAGALVTLAGRRVTRRR